MNFRIEGLDQQTLKHLYTQLVKPRLIEEKMLKLLRQGKISKWFSGIGQEAISVGAACAALPDEIIFTMHRNLGVFTARKMPLDRLFCQWQGKENGYSKGRERSFHFGAMEHNIVGMISHLGPQLSLADGVGLAHKLSGEQRIAIAFTGEGATSQGEFHEALNVAAVWQLPVLFIVENNGYGLSTPVNEQYRCASLIDKGIGYGMKAISIDGNNILEVYNTISRLADEMRSNPEPVMLECRTFRMRGHEEASGTKYVPKELFEEWEIQDPIKNFETYLLEESIISQAEIDEIKGTIQTEINAAWKKTEETPEVIPNTEAEFNDIYAPSDTRPVKAEGTSQEMRLINAVSDGLRTAMRLYPNMVIMGQDIAEYGGAFKVTDGFVQEFGKHRVRNTPLCESAIVGTALGLSLKGYKSVVEMQFADFVTCGFNQIINNLAKIHWRWGANADVVIRMPSGGGVGAGPFHSQSNEAWFFHTPGLKVVYPSNPQDAKGLLLASLADPNPVIFFEHKALYRSVSGEVPTGFYTEEIGKAKLIREGDGLSIITYGLGVEWAKAIAAEMSLDADILDLRTLLPLDYDAIKQTVSKTGRVLILHEDTLTGGIGGEISAYISQHLFDKLDAPVFRSASLDTPVPFAIPLEQNFFPVGRLKNQIRELLDY